MAFKILTYGVVFLSGLYLGYSLDKFPEKEIIVREEFRKPIDYKVREGFYRQPYDLRIKIEEIAGEIEVYLMDVETEENKKIGSNMHLGGLGDRLKGIVSYPFETKDNLINGLF